MIKAIVLDMDGLLFDTETEGLKACAWAGERQGILLKREEIVRALGMTEPASTLIYQKIYPRFDGVRFWADFQTWMDENVLCPRLMPGALELLEAAKEKGVAAALCSSSPRARILRFLNNNGILPMFDQIVSGDDGARSKPAPDMFLLAAERLKVRGEECLAFEDSPNGLRAAHGAGMAAYMVPDLLPYTDDLAPVVSGVLGSLHEAVPLLSKQ